MIRSLGLNDFLLLFKLNRLIVPFSSFILGFLLSPAQDFSALLLGLVAMVFIYAAAATLNDIFDLKIDSISNPTRPIPQRKLAISGALSIAATLAVIGLGISFYVANSAGNLLFFFLMFLELILGIVYASILSRNFVAANATLGLTHGVIPLFAGLVIFGGDLGESFQLIAILLWISLFLGYNIKDFKDVEGDMFSRSTLPSIFGVDRAKILVSWFLFFPFIATVLLKLDSNNFLGLIFSLMISLAIILLSRRLKSTTGKKNFASHLTHYRFLISLWIISLAF